MTESEQFTQLKKLIEDKGYDVSFKRQNGKNCIFLEQQSWPKYIPVPIKHDWELWYFPKGEVSEFTAKRDAELGSVGKWVVSDTTPKHWPEHVRVGRCIEHVEANSLIIISRECFERERLPEQPWDNYKIAYLRSRYGGSCRFKEAVAGYYSMAEILANGAGEYQ